jgi:hypothetical protein
MGSSGDSFGDRIPIALAALIALVFVAGLAAVAGWLALVLKAPLDRPSLLAPAFLSAPACRICGVVEQVRELERPAAPQPLNGDQSESIVVLIAALGGGPGRLIALPRTYETEVRLEDGSVRLLRDARTPLWKRGDRVKVMRGRVEPAQSDPVF